MLDARGYLLPSNVPQSKATTFGRITTEECGSPPWKMPFEDLPVVEKICMGCVLCCVPGDFLGCSEMRILHFRRFAKDEVISGKSQVGGTR